MPSCFPVRRIALLFLSAAALSIVGCGSGANQASIEGEVTLDGAPLEQGGILFLPIPGTSGTATGGEIRDGHYRLSAAKKLALGENRVEITAQRPTGKMVQDPLGLPGHMIEMYASAVAARFNVGSTLKVEIKPGSNTQNFAVESK